MADTSERVSGRSTSARRVIAGLLLSVLSAAVLIVIWTSFGDLWWLTPVAFVPMYVAQYRVLPRRWSGVAVGIAAAGYWEALFQEGSTVLPEWLIVGGALLIGLGWWLLGTPQRAFSERTGYRWFLVQFPIFWVGVDLLVQNNEMIGPGGWIAYRLGEWPQVIQPISIFGTPALSFLLLVINATIALAVLAAIDRRWPGASEVHVPRRSLLGSVAVAAVAVVAWTASSLFIYGQTTQQMGPTVRVAAVQTGLEHAASGTLTPSERTKTVPEDQRLEQLQAQLEEQTRQAAAQGAQLVIWPEEILSYDPRVEHTRWIPELVRETGVYLVAGFVVNASDFTSPNVALMWNPDGTVVEEYRKTKRVVAEGEAFTPGDRYPVVDTAIGRLGIIICFDMEFPDGPARRTALSGAQIIAVPSIDFASAAYARIASTVFRAVENRVGVAKADLAWDSVIAAPNGQVLGKIIDDNPRGAEGLLVEDLPLGPGNAPFTLYGGTPFQWLLNVAWVLLVAAMIVVAVRHRRARRQPTGE